MENEIDKKIISLSNITQLTTFTIAITVTFSLVRLFTYYIILLHIPIFQYLDVTDIVFMVPTGIFYTLFVGAVQAVIFVTESKKFEKGEIILYSILLYLFAGFIFWISYRNDPVIQQFQKMPLRYWYYWLVPFCIIIYVNIQANRKGGSFFKRNMYVGVFIITIWYGIFESFANYSVLTNSNVNLHYIMKFKNGNILKTSNDLIYAGRTKNMWFIYNRKTQFIRAIKNEDIELVDFDTVLK